MSKLIGRRSAIVHVAGAIAGIAVVPLVGATAASAASGTAAVEPSAAVGSRGFTDIHGIRQEYLTAVRKWPFDIPSGYALPPESQLRETSPTPTQWERGSGLAEAFSNWAAIITIAATAAHESGNEIDAQKWLSTLAAAYSSPTVQGIVDDPDGVYIKSIVGPALTGRDYAPLTGTH